MSCVMGNARQLGVFIFILVALSRVSLAQDSASRGKRVEGELIAREKQLADAERTHDTSVFKKLLRDDLVYVVFNGWVFTKSDVVSKMKYIDVNDYDLSNFKVRVPAPGTALITYDLKAKANIAGRNVPKQQYVSSLWVKGKHNWQLLFHQATPATHP